MAVFLVFLTLEVTEIFLFLGNLSTKTAALPPFATHNTTLIQIGGIIGVVTALVAWYTSAAGIANGMGGRLRLPVGLALLRERV